MWRTRPVWPAGRQKIPRSRRLWAAVVHYPFSTEERANTAPHCAVCEPAPVIADVAHLGEPELPVVAHERLVLLLVVEDREQLSPLDSPVCQRR